MPHALFWSSRPAQLLNDAMVAYISGRLIKESRFEP